MVHQILRRLIPSFIRKVSPKTARRLSPLAGQIGTRLPLTTTLFKAITTPASSFIKPALPVVGRLAGGIAKEFIKRPFKTIGTGITLGIGVPALVGFLVGAPTVRKAIAKPLISPKKAFEESVQFGGKVETFLTDPIGALKDIAAKPSTKAIAVGAALTGVAVVTPRIIEAIKAKAPKAIAALPIGLPVGIPKSPLPPIPVAPIEPITPKPLKPMRISITNKPNIIIQNQIL